MHIPSLSQANLPIVKTHLNEEANAFVHQGEELLSTIFPYANLFVFRLFNIHISPLTLANISIVMTLLSEETNVLVH